MQQDIPMDAWQYAVRNRRRKWWKNLVRVLACAVVFCTTYALILPAITMEKATVCGLEEHAHHENCYSQVLTQTVTRHNCSYETLGVHVHSDQCRDENGALICGFADFVVHTHTELCYDAEGQLICQLPEIKAHTHTDACYTQPETPEPVVHVHSESCYALEQSLTCGLEETGEHTHTEACYTQQQVLTCGLEEGQAEPVETPDPVLVCEKEVVEIHTHSDACYETHEDADGAVRTRLICGKRQVTEHIHTDACVIREEVPATDLQTLTCGLEESETHTHTDRCYGTWVLTCTLQEHTHADDCYAAEEEALCLCGVVLHSHSDACLDEEGNLICGLQEHTESILCAADLSSLSQEEAAQVEAVILQIQAIPTADEIDATLLQYEEAGDLDGQDAYFMALETQIRQVYAQYAALSEAQQELVVNRERLLELEYIWGNQMLASTYASSYATEITGYNLEANNIYAINAILGQKSGVNGDWGRHSKLDSIVQNSSVMFVDLKDRVAGTNGEITNTTCTVGEYFYSSDEATYKTMAKARKEQGELSLNLSEWYIIWIERAGERHASKGELIDNGHLVPGYEYPGFYVTDVYGKAGTDAELETMSTIRSNTTTGFLLMVRKSYVAEKKLYLPQAGDLVHLNQEPLQYTGQDELKAFRSVEGFRPKDGWDSGNSRGPFGYATFYDAKDELNADARAGDKSVVSNIDFKLFDYSWYINKTGKDESNANFRPLSESYLFNFRAHEPKDDGLNDYYLDATGLMPEKWNDVAWNQHDADGFTKGHTTVEPLLVDGYPVLDFVYDATGAATGTTPSGFESVASRSLAYLFNEAKADALRDLAPGAVTQYDANNSPLQFNANTHTYWYDSSQNAADYDTVNNLFRVRPYTERNANSADFGNAIDYHDFLPFNYSNGIVRATYYDHGDLSIAHGQTLRDSSFAMQDVNYWFGMTMEFSFIQGEDGKVVYTDSNGDLHSDEMIFTFSGDDDVWVFVDDVLVLDLGGTHGAATGQINFATGKIKQYLSWIGGSESNTSGDTATSFPTTLAQRFANAGKAPNGGWDTENTGRFADYSMHTLKFFYMERGAAVANCSIEFNLPSFDTPLVVGKTLDPVNEAVNPEVLKYLRANTEYSYRVLKTDSNGNPTTQLFFKEGDAYTLLENGKNLGTRKVGANGIFRLKHGQQAVFEDILAHAGYADVEFVVEELLPDCQTGHYNSVQYTLESGKHVITGQGDATLTGFTGYFSPVLSAGAPKQIQYHNTVRTDSLSVLKVSKAITEGSEFAADQKFTIRIKLDDEYLAADTKYSIGGTEYPIGDNGSITLRAGQTAEILVPVLAGTTFAVEEDAPDGCVVTYSSVTTAADGTQTTGTGSGAFPLGGSVHVTVTNSTYVSRILVPFTKQALGNTGKTTFQFRVTQVNASGNAVTQEAGKWEHSPTVTVNGENTGSAQIAFVYESTVADGTYYYKLTEVAADGWVCDSAAYIIKIEVTDGNATVLSVTRNGVSYGKAKSPAFVNYLDTQITVDKQVVGNETAAQQQTPFSFTAEVKLNGVVVAPSQGSGYTVASDGTVSFTLTHGQSVIITGIPYGAVVTVEETEAPGYSTHYTLGTAAQKYSGRIAANVATAQEIHFVNNAGYELPNTGGSGLIPYAMAGLLLMLFSTAYLLYKQKHRERGAT